MILILQPNILLLVGKFSVNVSNQFFKIWLETLF